MMSLLPISICMGCVLPVGLTPLRPARQAEAAAPIRVFWMTTPEGLRCTAFSVGEGRVATAAHCIGASGSGTLTDAASGQVIPVAGARVNPAWPISRTIGTDAAVLQAQDAQGLAGGRAVFVSRAVMRGDVLTLVTPDSGERQCPVLGQSGAWIELSCRVEDGWSGAPLLFRDEDGATIAGILSGRGTEGQRNLAEVSHASAVEVLLGR